ncbi:MAG: hypothetical protein EOO41_01070 [Methanobacteriota archaeon]|nr:MAG: hypothetical protein EOO41_01070 [Euryarchaeota archaeon]
MGPDATGAASAVLTTDAAPSSTTCGSHSMLCAATLAVPATVAAAGSLASPEKGDAAVPTPAAACGCATLVTRVGATSASELSSTEASKLNVPPLSKRLPSVRGAELACSRSVSSRQRGITTVSPDVERRVAAAAASAAAGGGDTSAMRTAVAAVDGALAAAAAAHGSGVLANSCAHVNKGTDRNARGGSGTSTQQCRWCARARGGVGAGEVRAQSENVPPPPQLLSLTSPTSTVPWRQQQQQQRGGVTASVHTTAMRPTAGAQCTNNLTHARCARHSYTVTPRRRCRRCHEEAGAVNCQGGVSAPQT